MEEKDKIHWSHMFWSKKELKNGDKDRFEEGIKRWAENYNPANTSETGKK